MWCMLARCTGHCTVITYIYHMHPYAVYDMCYSMYICVVFFGRESSYIPKNGQKLSSLGALPWVGS